MLDNAEIAKGRINTAKALSQKLNIDSSMIDYIEEQSQGQNTTGYHNFQHLLTVAINAIRGANYYFIQNQNMRQALFIAGLAHDLKYDPMLHESVNIKKATNFVLNTLPAKNFASNRIVYPIAADLVQATYFPHRISSSLEEKIIQDADLLQNLEPDAELFRKGLDQEQQMLNSKKSLADPNFPPLELLNTEWAKNLMKQQP